MAKSAVKFERFLGRQIIISTGMANVNLSLESVLAIVFFGVLTALLWSVFGFPLVIPLVNINASPLVPLIGWIFPFLVFKFATVRRPFLELLEDLKSIYVPKIEIVRDEELIPPYLDKE
jgi:hypothetical protein